MENNFKEADEFLKQWGWFEKDIPRNIAMKLLVDYGEMLDKKIEDAISTENKIKNIPSIEIIESEIEKRWGQPTSKSYIARPTRNEVAQYLYQFIVNLKRWQFEKV